MKKLFLLLTLLVSIAGFSQNETIDAFLEKWQNSKIYLIEMAKAMPEEKYNYKPTEREMSFAAQLLHIKDNMDWLSTSYFTDKKYDKNKEETKYSNLPPIK